jgi:hypothetical protein
MTFNRTGRLSAKLQLQGHIEQALKGSPTATEFIEQLQLSGVETIPYIDKSGRATGISFRKGKELMKGSDLGRGFSWNALQQRGLNYEPERDRPTIEAAKRAASGREIVAAPQPERTFMDVTKDIGRQAGEYLINQANPVRQFESQVRTLESTDRGSADGVSALLDAFTRQDRTEQLSHAVTPDTNGRDAIERLQEAVGIEPTRYTRDALDRLDSVMPSKNSPADLTPSLDKATPELTPALEPEIEEHVLVPVIEFMF